MSSIPKTLLQKVFIVLEMIKFEHTLFALPFALMAMLLAARDFPSPGNRLPSARVIILIVVACYAARSAAMAFNRLADLEQDRENPRTRNRALPAGLLSPHFVRAFTLAHIVLFLWTAWMLNWLAFALSPVALAIILGYSYVKRFSFTTHFILGLALGIAPMGAWIAVRGSFDIRPMILSLAVLLWTAGFDIIYACQDYAFDVSKGLHSIPARFGIPKALVVSSGLHVLAWLALMIFAWAARSGWLFIGGVVLVGFLLIYEHAIVKPNNLSRVNVAFFNVNGVVGILLFLCFLLEM
ncbi:MAG: putative 4-hydroxybenzoate polyprenyltransferase [Candidatus Sumerlaeia bacterium]|nr:putative 4-hydroxybenzoate polyprenyltransferase [Candidatus Sumerlaeia bacterium]